MSKSTKLIKVGNQVLNSVQSACMCWDDVVIFNQSCLDKYFTFDVHESKDHIGSNLIGTVSRIISSYETVDICRALYTIEVVKEDEKTIPVIHVIVSLK